MVDLSIFWMVSDLIDEMTTLSYMWKAKGAGRLSVNNLMESWGTDDDFESISHMRLKEMSLVLSCPELECPTG